MIPIAFYAPLKSPLHPEPSGDRTMARLLLSALAEAGFGPELASEIRTFDRSGDAAAQQAIRAASEAAAGAVAARYRSLPARRRPRLWFTYHVYYKAPDWIGPAVSEALGIPYAVAEGSRAGKRATGSWSLGHRGAEAALDRAAVVFVMTPQDRPGLEGQRPAAQALPDLPPFIDESWLGAGGPAARPGGPPVLVTVAMMRPGDKLESYRILAEALAQLGDLPWTLDIVGDGPQREAVETLFSGLQARVAFRGALPVDRVRDCLDSADLFVWPAVNEAYGMALLEAQARGCPVLAGRSLGVATVVADGVTGLLTPPGDVASFAAALRGLLRDGATRRRFGQAARDFVVRERTLAGAARRLRAALLPLSATAGE